MSALRTASLTVLAVFGLTVAATGVEAQDPPPPPEIQTQQQTLVQSLEQQGNFTMFVNAIRTAGLEEQLAAAGPFTVFAPTDEAFQAIPQAELDALMASPESLTELVNVHIVSQDISTNPIMTETQDTTATPPEPVRLATLAGTEIELSRQNDVLHVTLAPAPAAEVMREEQPAMTGAMIVSTDAESASNGTIVVIDKVLLPGK